jgi:hypothetical protein
MSEIEIIRRKNCCIMDMDLGRSAYRPHHVLPAIGAIAAA